MFKIALNRIHMSRGDNARFSITLEYDDKDNQVYELSEKDQVYFIVTDIPKIISLDSLDSDPSCLFYKTGVSILLEPEDTLHLDEGVYYYQVRVVLGESGDLNTIIEPEEFILTPVKGW